ncbi:hypothetical protein BDZ45DRAFT_734792 [Acephala macrosclerotiorum]|nr:hypothetical protein BDZ45DRAFT_734792 [Acephala macrosclerotiorum]
MGGLFRGILSCVTLTPTSLDRLQKPKARHSLQPFRIADSLVYSAALFTRLDPTRAHCPTRSLDGDSPLLRTHPLRTHIYSIPPLDHYLGRRICTKRKAHRALGAQPEQELVHRRTSRLDHRPFRKHLQAFQSFFFKTRHSFLISLHHLPFRYITSSDEHLVRAQDTAAYRAEFITLESVIDPNQQPAVTQAVRPFRVLKELRWWIPPQPAITSWCCGREERLSTWHKFGHVIDDAFTLSGDWAVFDLLCVGESSPGRKLQTAFRRRTPET